MAACYQFRKLKPAKSSKAEVIGRCMWIGGIVVFIASLAGLPFYTGMTGVIISQLCMGTALIGIGLVVFGASANMRAWRERNGRSPEAFRKMLQNMSEVPDLSRYDTSKAILTLYWSMNYPKHARLNSVLVTCTPLGPVTAFATSVAFVLMAHYFQGSRMLELLVVFIASFLVILGLIVVLSAENYRKYYSKQIPDRTIVLIVDQTGINLIIGKNHVLFSWSEVKRCRSIPGAAIIDCRGRSYIVPGDAFHKPEDRLAFIATLNAMKSSKPAPVHDWSAYAPINLQAEGVWPPPI